jgi:hypothetical protein
LGPPLTGQYLATPALCPPEKMPVKYKHLFLYDQNEFAPVLPQEAIDMYRKWYSPDREDD